jgi:hypothetical protein
MLLSGAGAIALAAFAFAGGAQAQQCWSSVYGYYSCAAPPATYYYPQMPTYAPTPYAAWYAYDYRDYRREPLWVPSYPGPRASSGTFGVR